VDEASLSELAEQQIRKGIFKGDTMICGYRLTWKAKSILNSDIRIRKTRLKETTHNHNVSERSLLRAVTIQRDTVTIGSETIKPSIIIFANNYSCLKCFDVLNSWLLNQIDTSKVNIVLLMRVGTEVLSRRSFMNEMKPIFTSTRKLVFDIQMKTDTFPPVKTADGLFSQFNITKTPSVVVYNGNKQKFELFLQYEELMDSKGAMRSQSGTKIKDHIN
jgi:hypothetical protein